MKKSISRLTYLLFLVFLAQLWACKTAKEPSQNTALTPAEESIHKPFARYWWFASEIKKEDVKFNLDWLKEKGFGGVELAWVYPLNSKNTHLDPAYTPRQEWLSKEWIEIVNYAIKHADSIGLACDLTMGTLWPFGDSRVSYEEASQTYGSEERQVISRSWEYPKKGYVVDHLNQKNYLKYFDRMLEAFPQPETQINQAYFIDSWEVETQKLWCEGFEEDFMEAYDYDIRPYMDKIYDPEMADQRYDYMKLISGKVIDFYACFDSVLNSRDLLSRGQCSGAPCDIISAYAKMDIPEGEAMLYEPEFNSIPASAALLSGKKITSSETFTCLYGWPGDYIREEQTADLKLVADALFANGVNHIFWHGKPHNPANQDTVNFYASVHLGKDGTLAPNLVSFNRYLEKVSGYMKKGHTYGDVAVYLPTEEAWIKGIMPKEKQFIWAWGYYEMRYVYFPDELQGYSPKWINAEFLEKAKYEDGLLMVGDASFKQLYVDTRYIDYQALKRIYALAEKGLPVCLKQDPKEPGMKKHDDYTVLLENLSDLASVSRDFVTEYVPLVQCNQSLNYWVRKENEVLYLFFAQPKAGNIKFPLQYGQSFMDETIRKQVQINYQGQAFDLELVFEPYKSLLYKIDGDQIENIDLEFLPEPPQIKERPEGYKAPWLVY